MKRPASTLLSAFAVAALLTPALRAEPAATQPASAYPLDTCVISGDKLGGDMGPPIVETIDGREVHFCCAACVTEFKKDVEANNRKMDEAIVAVQKPTYPLKTCPVSGEELGTMGDPILYVDHHSNQLIELCCKGCLSKVKADPTDALAENHGGETLNARTSIHADRGEVASSADRFSVCPCQIEFADDPTARRSAWQRAGLVVSNPQDSYTPRPARRAHL